MADSASRKRKVGNDESRDTTDPDAHTAAVDGGGDQSSIASFEPDLEDEGGAYGDSDEPDAEGDEPEEPEVEPSEENFGKIKFYGLCKSLEKISTRRASLQHKLMNLLPPKAIAALKETKPGDPPQTIFPLVRLLCPEKDASREYFVKHNTLAKAYIRAHAWQNDNVLAQALLKPNDPQKIAKANIPPVQGDLTELIRQVLKGRVSEEPSSLTVADINRALNELAALKHRGNMRPTNHDWEAGDAAAKRRKKEAGEKLSVLQAEWVKRFLSGSRRLSPLEHKWLARMVLKEMKISCGFDKILYWFDPNAPFIFSGHNSLRGVCKIICQPDYRGKAVVAQTGDGDSSEDEGVRTVAPYLLTSSAKIQLGVPFTPMFSHRTGFDRMLYDLSSKHREFVKNPSFGKLEEASALKAACCTVLEHPSFTIETKLDGERMLVHLSRDGIVKIHTRQSNWYSDVYSPVLGPAIREAFGHHRMDMIIDGEVLAWDDDKKETIPFGNNKTVAAFRAEWMKYQGLLDARDRDVHHGEADVKVIHMNKIWQDGSGQVPDLNGRDCWLQYIAFDVVFLDGEGAKEALDKAISPFLRAKPGSLMDVECMERKKLLYHLIRPVPRLVEVVPTLVVASDGETYLGSEYFSLENPPSFAGRPLHSLDSAATFLYEMSNPKVARTRKGLEEERRQGLTNEEISQKRALAVGDHYNRIVEDQRQEGLVFKDLSTPYVLDKVSRSLGFWRKFKPDYFNGSTASDVDLLIIGAYFATGLRNSGRPSSFLCACTIDQEEDKFMPLCKVNGGSVTLKEMKAVLEHTGYKVPHDASEALETGKWFTLGESRRDFPDFVSSNSFASDPPTTTGWKAKKEDYPDLWIEPKDSLVLTLNAGEIVPTTAFPSRVTLRFPRITAIRTDKSPWEVESLQNLWDTHDRVLDDRARDNSEQAFESQAQAISDSQVLKERFWTEEKYLAAGKGTRKKRPKTLHSVVTVDTSVAVDSAALEGVSFVALEGTYRLIDNSLEAAEAQEEGWLVEAKAMKDHHSMQAFIKRHGGTLLLAPDAKVIDDGAMIIGGDKNDPRVINLVEKIESAQSKAPELRMKKKLTKGDKDNLVFAKCPGVVRWTFLLSALSKWRSTPEGHSSQERIADKHPNLLVPEALDFLARPKSCRGSVVEDFSRIDVRDITKMRRLLNEFAETKRDRRADDESEVNRMNWKEVCKASLDPNDRWIMRCSHQTLWPYREEKVVIQETVAYPDVFSEPQSASNGLSKVDPYKHSALLSVLPLLRMSGAFIESRLGGRVTHILCKLHVEFRKIAFEKAKPEHFLDPDRGQQLLEEVKRSSLYPDCCPDFVSPAWVREDVWNRQEEAQDA